MHISRFANSHGSAGFIWHALGSKYLGDGQAWRLRPDELWKLWRRDSLMDCERWTLLSTFDRAILGRGDFQRMADAFDQFVEFHPPGDHVCSLPDQANLIRRLAGPAPGLSFLPSFLAWWQTSTSENPWSIPEKSSLYNPSRGKSHFMIGQVLAI